LSAYDLISTDDRRVKDAETFRRERGEASGFARDVARQIASFIAAVPLERTIRGARATVKLRLRLPDANAAEIAALVLDWDEPLLNAVSRTEQEQITQKLTQLHRDRRIPMLEGEETFTLVREGSG